jgi:AraC family transcriptional regulator
MRSRTRTTFRPRLETQVGEQGLTARRLLGGGGPAGDDSTTNPPGSPDVGINGSGRARPSGPIASRTVDKFATETQSDSSPDRMCGGDRPGVLPVLTDASLLHFPDGILSRLPSGEMTVVASTQALGWESIHGVITDGRLGEFFDYSAPYHIVAFNLRGATTVEWKHGLRFTRFQAQPGALLITPSGEANSIRLLQRNEAFSCCLSPDRLQSLAEQEWDPHGQTIEIAAGYNRDAELWRLGQRLAARLRSPIPGSRLFAETLLTQIAIELLWNYSSLPRQSHTPEEKLTDPRLRRVIEYLHGSFAEETSLDALAQVAGLSPNYFLHAFKQTTGRTPHRYLTELRIAKACELLHNPYRSIVEISLAVGFSSQSHLTTVFRRFMKTTPAAYREEVLGIHIPEPSPTNSERSVSLIRTTSLGS